MDARNVQLELCPANVKAGAGILVPRELFGLNHAAAHTEGHDLVILGAAHLAEVFVIGVHDQGAALLESVSNRNLFLEHTVQIAKAFQMARSHVGNHGHVGFRCKRKRANFVRAARAHLDDSSLVAAFELEQRHRDSDMVVVVALRGVRIVACRKDGLHHFLGRRLAIAASDADLLNLEATLITLGQLKQGLGSIVYRGIHFERTLLHGILINNAHQCTVLLHLVNKLVGVKTDTLDWPKNHALRRFSRIHAKVHLSR